MHLFTILGNMLPVLTSRLMALLGLLITSWLFNVAQAQSFTAAQVEGGTDCNWPFSAVATNPVDGKVYGFWRKGSGTTATYKLIRFDGSSWTAVGSFSAASVAANFGASDDVKLAIDATGKFHVVFQGEIGGGVCCNSTRGVWYGSSTNGSSWAFSQVQTFSDPSGWKNTDDPIIELDASNQPHVVFLYSDANNPRLYTLRYYRYDGSTWTGQDAFSQTGGSTVSNEITHFDFALDGSGKAHIAFQRETDGSGRDGGLWYVTNNSGSWTAPLELAHGVVGQVQGATIAMDTDASNKVHIVHSNYQDKLLYVTNTSGSFTSNQINGDLTGGVQPHNFRFNSNGDRFLALSGERYAYLLAGASGNWTVGTYYTQPTGAQAGTFISGILAPNGRAIILFDNLPSGSCSADNPRNLWYATATIAPASQFSLSNITKASQQEDVTVAFTSADFANATTGGSLTKIKITGLPTATTGVLKLSGTAVTLNQEIVVASLGNLTFVPATNYNGSASFLWNGSIGADYAATSASVNITLLAVNDVPVANAQSVTTDEDVAEAITLTGSDVENSTLTYTIVAQPAHGTLSGTGATRTYTPAANYNGSDSFTFKVNDGTIDGNTATVSITVTPVNDAPVVANAIANVEVNEDANNTGLDLTNTFADADGDNLTITIASNSNPGLVSASYSNITKELTFDYVANAYGTATIGIKAADGTSDITESFTVTVNPINDAPSFTKGADQVDDEDAGAQTVASWATSISAGPNEDAQTIDFIVTNNNNSLFSAQPSISDNGTLTYTSAANAFGSATVNVKLKDNGGTTNGGDDESNIVTFTITVNAVNDAPVVTNNKVTQEVQYSDQVIPVTVTATDVDNTYGDLTESTSWKLNSGSFVAGLPASLSLVAGTGLNNSQSWTLTGRMRVASGTYTIRVKVNDGTADEANNLGFTDLIIEVTREVATVDYSGNIYFSTGSPTSNTATIALSATVTDPADNNRGDIRNAKVDFYNENKTGPFISPGDLGLNVGLVNSNDLTVGSATQQDVIALSSNQMSQGGDTYVVTTKVSGVYYSSADVKETITIIVPGLDFVTGAGKTVLSNPAGKYKGDVGSRMNLGLNLKWNKSGKNLQGQITILFRKYETATILSNNMNYTSTGWYTYKIKSNAISSLSIVASGDYKKAIISTKGNLERTNPQGIVESLGGGYDLSVEAWENTKVKDGSQDMIAVTLREASTKSSGGNILFSNNWNGTKTIAQVLSTGKFNVRSSAPQTTTAPKTESVVNDADIFTGIETKFTSYPNPFTNQATIAFAFDKDEDYSLEVYDMKGQLIKKLQTDKAKASSLVQVNLKADNLAAGVYLVKLSTTTGVRQLRIVRE